MQARMKGKTMSLKHARRLSKPQWMKAFAKALREVLGNNYPIPRDDWSAGDYGWAMEMSPAETARKVIAKRGAEVGRREPLKVWVKDGGRLDFGTRTMDPSVVLTINAAIQGGCRHGTVKHWENRFPGSSALWDVELVLYLWELLD